MKKSTIFLLCLIAPALLQAQISISTQVPPAGLVSKDYLWNIVLTNNKEAAIDVNVRINLQDPSSGDVLMSANSGNFVLGKGVKVMTARDVQPVQYNYNNQDFSRSYLPLGAYIVCYQVYYNGEDIAGEECMRLNIDPLSPPLLNMPGDNSVVETPYPQFTWMPPTAADMFNELRYGILVAELEEGQTAFEAIQYNVPVYSRTNISQPFENYPTSFKALEPGKKYVWEVIARNGINYAAKTEIWSFTVKKDSIAEIVSGAPYLKLEKNTQEMGIAHQGFLKMKLRNYLADSTGHFVVRNLSKSNEKSPSIAFSFSMPIVRGENFLMYDMSKHGKLNKDDVYEVEYKNSTGETCFMRFIPVYYK